MGNELRKSTMITAIEGNTMSLMNPEVTYYLEGFDKGSDTVKRSDLKLRLIM